MGVERYLSALRRPGWGLSGCVSNVSDAKPRSFVKTAVKPPRGEQLHLVFRSVLGPSCGRRQPPPKKDNWVALHFRGGSQRLENYLKHNGPGFHALRFFPPPHTTVRVPVGGGGGGGCGSRRRDAFAPTRTAQTNVNDCDPLSTLEHIQMDTGDLDQAPGEPPQAAEAGPTLAHAPAEGPGEGLASVPASARGGSGLGLAPAPAYAPMAGDGLYARRPFNKRMPRDPVTNLRICFEFVRGACPRPPGTCRYSHNTPPQLLAAYQSMAMGTGDGGESVAAAAAAAASSLGVPFAPPLQQEPQPQPSTR